MLDLLIFLHFLCILLPFEVTARIWGFGISPNERYLFLCGYHPIFPIDIFFELNVLKAFSFK